MTAPPSWLTASLAVLTGCGGAVVGVMVIGRVFAEQDIGINAAANSFALVYLVLPVLAVVNCVVFVVVFRWSYAGAARFGVVAAGALATVLGAGALAAMFWGALTLGLRLIT